MSDSTAIKAQDIPTAGLVVPLRKHYRIYLTMGNEQVIIHWHDKIGRDEVNVRITASKKVEIIGARIFAKIDAQKEEISRLKSYIASLEIQQGNGRLQ